jgi:hypothetical protein
MMTRPPRSRAVRLKPGTKKPLDLRWPSLVLPDRLYFTRRRQWACRAGDGLWVLDFDAKEDHLAVLAGWEAAHGRLAGWRVHTPSSGLHCYLRAPDDRPRPARIPVESGQLGVELKTHTGQYVVWPGARFKGREYIAESPLKPLPLAPAWLIEMAGTPPPKAGSSPLGDGGQSSVERDRYGTPAEYVERLGLGPIEGGCICCPAPDHEDREPSCQVRGHNLKCWTHPGGPLTMRARQLAAIALGLGEYRKGAWVFDSSEDRAAVDAHLDELFPRR